MADAILRPSSDPDDCAIQIAAEVVARFGADEAPGIVWAALVMIHEEHLSLDACVFAVEQSVAVLRKKLVENLVPEGTIQ